MVNWDIFVLNYNVSYKRGYRSKDHGFSLGAYEKICLKMYPV